jgi:ribulose kinase
MLSLHWFKHWDKVFWVFFLVMALSVVAGGAIGIVSFEYAVLLGVLIIITGAGKLASEISHRKLLGYQNDTYKKMHQMSQHLEKTFSLASMNKEKNEFRIQKLDEKRKNLDRKVDRNYRELLKNSEKNYRDLARKIIELENRANRMAKALGIERKR